MHGLDQTLLIYEGDISDKAMNISFVLLACLASTVSCDLAALLRFAQGGPPPVASARQIGGVKLDSALRDTQTPTGKDFPS